MEESLKESGEMAGHGMAKERISTQMEEFTKEIGKVASFMDKESCSTQMEESTKESWKYGKPNGQGKL